jgi:SPOR domain
MAVTTSFSGSRRSKAHAAAFAAKQRRQKMLIAGGLVLLALILAYEVPHTLKLMNGSSPPSGAPASSEAAPETAPAAPAAPVHSSAAWRALRHLPPQDPFANPTPGASGTLAAVAVPSNLHDPFTAPPSSTSSGSSSSKPTTTTSTSSASTALPKTIVVGSPGAGRTAKTGWIVILASIPSAQGRSAADAFAKKAATRGVGKVSILNSSTARPLRGGYWVVYTGPFQTLTAVTNDASHLHASGYGSAYIRQLVVYGKS